MAKFWDLKIIRNKKKKSRINQEMVNTIFLPRGGIYGAAGAIFSSILPALLGVYWKI